MKRAIKSVNGGRKKVFLADVGSDSGRLAGEYALLASVGAAAPVNIAAGAWYATRRFSPAGPPLGD